jgi:hypothetical protein
VKIIVIPYYLIELEYITRHTDKKRIFLQNVVIQIYRYTDGALYAPYEYDSIEAEREIKGGGLTAQTHIDYTEIIVYAYLWRILEGLSQM